MKKVTRFLTLCAVLLTVSFFSARPVFQPVSAQQIDQDIERILSDPQEFEMLSSAAQNLFQLRFGRRPGSAPTDSLPFPPRPSEGQSDVQDAQAQIEPDRDSRIRMALGNPIVNDPWLDSTARDTQSETTIAFGSVSWQTGNQNLIVGYNDSGSFSFDSPNPPANKFTGFSRSFDDGGIWRDEGSLTTNPNGDAGDPVLARNDVTGRLYFSTLQFVGSGLNVFRSDDDAATWLTPVNGAPGIAAGFQDKEWMAVDNFPGPGQQNTYLAWRSFTTGLTGIRFTRSNNNGASFEPPGGTLIASAGAFNVQGAAVTVGADSAVYVFWLDQSAGAGTPNLIRMRKSTDQGLTFGPPITVAPLLTTETNGGLGAVGGFRTAAFPAVAVNPTNANHLFVVYNDNPAGADSGNIYFRQSIDGGATWTSQFQLNNDATTRLQVFPAIAVTPDGSRLAVSWYDRRRDPADALIERWGVIATISGNSVTFGPNFRIGDQFPAVFGGDPIVNAVYMGDYDTMIANNNFFYGVWGDNRDPSRFAGATRNSPDIRFAKIPVAGPGAILDIVQPVISGGDGDGVIEPNECVDLTIQITNNGSATGTGITAELTNFTSLVTVTQSASTYPNLVPAQTAANATPFRLSVAPNFPCVPIELKLVLTHSGGVDTAYLTLPSCQCPPLTVPGALTSADPQQTNRLFRDGVPSACGVSKGCSTIAGTFRYDSHTFTNGASPVCVKVDISTDCQGANFIFAAAYAGSFNQASICTNFLADTGVSPFPNASMSFNVAPNQTFVVVVSEVAANAGCPAYTVTVSGLVCEVGGPGVCPASFTEPQQANLKPGGNPFRLRSRDIASALAAVFRSPGRSSLK